MTAAKPIFTTVAQAQQALMADKLGTVYRRADKVFVMTATGSGTFSVAEWDRK